MLSVAVQAGGRSRRMGRDKATIPLAGKPLVEHVLERIMGLGEDLFITSNHPETLAYLGVRLVKDRTPGQGALHGLLTALEAARGDHVLVVACDMPFVSRSLSEYMLEQALTADVVIPTSGGYFEPMHAVYSKACLQAVRDVIALKQVRVTDFFHLVEINIIGEDIIRSMAPSGLNFFNINNQHDLFLAELILSRFDQENKEPDAK